MKFNFTVLLLILFSITYCRSNELEMTLFDVKIFITPFPKSIAKNIIETRSDIDNKNSIKLCKKRLGELDINGNKLMLWGNELIYNLKSYGEIAKNSIVKIKNDTVYINNKTIKGISLNKETKFYIYHSKNCSVEKLGNHHVYIFPKSALSTLETKYIKNKKCYILKNGKNRVFLKNDSLTVNDKSYGKLKPNSIIHIEEKNVSINPNIK